MAAIMSPIPSRTRVGERDETDPFPFQAPVSCRPTLGGEATVSAAKDSRANSIYTTV